MQYFLLEYRNTAHSTTGQSPSMLLLGRPLKDALTQLLPKVSRKALSMNEKMRVNLERQKSNFKGHRLFKFNEGDEVYVQLNDTKFSWTKATIVRRLNEKCFLCRLKSGRERKFH